MTLAKPIKGIIGACLTPFDENDRVDYKALEKEIDFLVSDCDAITIAAVEAAEYTMLTREERQGGPESRDCNGGQASAGDPRMLQPLA